MEVCRRKRCTPLFQVFISTFPHCIKFASLSLVLVCVCVCVCVCVSSCQFEWEIWYHQHRQLHHQAQPCSAQPNGTSWCSKIIPKNSERHNPTTEHAGKEKILRILSMKIRSEIMLSFVTIFSSFSFFIFYAFCAHPLQVSWCVVDLNI
jgi:hypothetical protein